MVSAIDAPVRDRSTTAPSWPFTLERVTGSLGAEISGVELSQPLSPALVEALSAALVEHKVLFFRDQDITTEQHLAFARLFGALEVHPFGEAYASFSNSEEHPEIVRVESTPDKPAASERWHTDVSWRAEPSLGSVLRCRIAPAYGGDTLWANMVAAYEGLDDATRSRISGMTAIHDWCYFRENLRSRGVPEQRIAALQAEYPPVEHPVVRTHPVSGEKILYVNASFTMRIKDMAEEESRSLLERLYRQSAVPDYQVRFRWRNDSVAFWDNRSTHHRVAADFFPQHRLMERATIIGDRPF